MHGHRRLLPKPIWPTPASDPPPPLPPWTCLRILEVQRCSAGDPSKAFLLGLGVGRATHLAQRARSPANIDARSVTGSGCRSGGARRTEQGRGSSASQGPVAALVMLRRRAAIDGSFKVIGCRPGSRHAGAATDRQESCPSVRRPLRVLRRKRPTVLQCGRSGQVPRRSHWARMAGRKAGSAGRADRRSKARSSRIRRSQCRVTGNRQGAQFWQSGLSTVSADEESGSGTEDGELSMIQPQAMRRWASAPRP